MDMWKKIYCGKIFGGGIDFFFFFVGIFRYVIFLAWEFYLFLFIFLVLWFWSWNNELNFCVAKPQELR